MTSMFDDLREKYKGQAKPGSMFDDLREKYKNAAPADPAVPTPQQVSAEAKANESGTGIDGAARYGANLIQQAMDSVTPGVWDEYTAAFWNPISAAKAAVGAEAPDGDYYKQLGQLRAQRHGFEQSNPVAAGAAQIGGAIVTPAPGMAWAAKAASLGGKAARSALISGAYGTATGFGQGEGSVENRAEKAVGDGGISALIGALLPPVAVGAGKAVSAVKRAVEPLTEAGRQRAAERALAEGVTGVKTTAAEFQPAAQKAIENIDAAQTAAQQINEPLGLAEGLVKKLTGDNPGTWAGDRWVGADGQTVMKPYQPTTGAAIGTPQALGFENRQRVANSAPFIERGAQNNDALTAAINTLDSGDPAAARQAFAAQGAERVQAAEAAFTQAQAELARKQELAPKFIGGVEQRGQQALAKAEADVSAARAELEAARSEALANSGRAPEDIGTSTYQTVREQHLPAALQKRDAVYGEIPNERVSGSAGLRQTAQGVINPFETAPAPANAIVNAPPRPVQPPRVVGQGPFGDIYEGPRGADAVRLLQMTQGGEVKGALWHPDLGDIDLPWGFYDAATDKGAGLAKLIDKHPEVLGDLDGLIARMPISEKGSSRVILDDGAYRAVVNLTHSGKEKQWLLSAYEKKTGGAVDNTSGFADSYAGVPGHRTANQGAPEGKDTANPITGQQLGDFTSHELLQIRREANRVAREAAYSDPVKARKAQAVAAEASRLLNESPAHISGRVKAADDYYANEFAPNFRQGPGKDIATRGPQGQESRMSPSLALTEWIRPDSTRGSAGNSAADRAAQLRRIGGDDPEIITNVRDHFANLVAQRAVSGDKVSADQIGKILTEYQSALDRFPEVKEGLQRLRNKARAANDQLDAALSIQKETAQAAQGQLKRAQIIATSELSKMQQAVDAARKNVDATGKAFDQSLPGIFANSDPEVAVKKALAQPDPAATVRGLLDAAKIAGPEALGGVKQAFTDWLKSQTQQLSRTSADGGGIGGLKMSAAQLEKLVGKDGKYRRALQALYTPQEMNLLDSVRQEMSRTALLSQRATSGSDTAEKLPRADTILHQFRQWMYGGSSISVMSGNFGAAGLTGLAALAAWRAEKSKTQIAAIIQDAMLNPEIAKAMLGRATEQNARKAITLFDRIANNAPRAGVAAAAMSD